MTLNAELKRRPFRRALAVLLCVQPVFWMSNAALAQSMDQLGSAGAPSTAAPMFPAPAAPTETEVVRGERSVLNQPVVLTIPLEEPLDPNKYVCGRGDVFELNFWGVQNFRLRVAIDVEGRAFVSRVGYLDLQGKTLTEARRVLRQEVGRYYPRLSFDVTLVELRTFLVHVVETVGHAGVYTARQVDRVSKAIGQAGGIGKGGSQRRIEIHRRDGTLLHADLLLYALTGDGKYNPYLLDGDVIRVPPEQLTAAIGGAVHRPGRYELVASKDSAELLQLAGGTTPDSTTLLPLRLVRRTPQDREEQQQIDFAPGGAVPPFAVQNDDVLTVPRFTELQQMVTVIGAVAGATVAREQPTTPGTAGAVTSSAAAAVTPEEATATRHLPYVQGDSVRTLLERVGGVGPLADLSGSYILRQGQTIPVDLYTLVMLRDFKADRPVELGDTLVVPFKRRNVLVEGAVSAPGSYPYNPNFGIEQYLALAGGRNRFARSLSDVKLVAPNGDTQEFKPDLKVEPGSSLVVPERNFSRSEVVQILLGAVGIVLSGVAVVLAARK